MGRLSRVHERPTESRKCDGLMKVNTDLDKARQAHASSLRRSFRSAPLPNQKLRCPMLILTLLALVAIPVAIDLALRGRHQTIELSMARSAATLDKSALM